MTSSETVSALVLTVVITAADEGLWILCLETLRLLDSPLTSWTVHLLHTLPMVTVRIEI